MNTPTDPERAERQRIIMAEASTTTGWKRSTLVSWGVPWPPPPGWKDTIIRHGFPYDPTKNERAKKRHG